MGIKNVLVRILQDVEIEAKKYFCNEVVSLPAKLAQTHEDAGNVDSDSDAVAYARDQLGSVPKEHVSPVVVDAVASVPQPAAPAADPALATQGEADGQAAAQASAPEIVSDAQSAAAGSQ